MKRRVRSKKRKPRARKRIEERYVDTVKFVDDYLGMEDWRVRENANIPYSFSSMFLQAAGKTVTRYTLSKVYPREISRAHIKGDFHIHNLPFGLTGYCAGWSIKDLLLRGFSGVPGRTESSPSRHFSSALLQISNFLGSIQNEWAGAQAMNSLDVYLAPFVRKDGLGYTQVKQAMQEFIYNLNISSRWGGQTPFTNITFELKVPEDMRNEPVIYGGKTLDETYTDYQPEADLINRAFLDVMREGDMHGRIFTFPIPTYNVTKDFDWGSEVSKFLFAVTAKFGIPYFQNCIGGGIDPHEVRSMCLHPDEPVIVRRNGKIERTTIKEAAGSNGYDLEGWKEANGVEFLSLNPKTYKVEWARAKRFLRIKGQVLMLVKTKDGKVTRLSENHPVAIYTKDGIKVKFAGDLDREDILLTVKKSEGIFNNEYQKVGEKLLDEKLAYLIGFFVADGNYLYESRENWKGRPRGIQFNFDSRKEDLQEEIKSIVKGKYDYNLRFVQDPRYDHSLRAYLYSEKISREWMEAGIKKYGKVSDIIFSSPLRIVRSFIKGFFEGDGCKRGNEIHINDEELAEDLTILMSLAGINCTYRKRKNSQTIRIQHVLGRGSKRKKILRDILYNQVPKFIVQTGRTKPFYRRGAMVSKSALERRDAHTAESLKLLNSDIALIRIESIEKEFLSKEQEFYDVELDKNHFFIHSLGNITHNCCRLMLDMKELYRRLGGYFGYAEKTGSVGVVTINMPRLGYLSKEEDEFFEGLGRLMELAKQSLEIKRKLVEQNMERGFLPFSKRYLGTLKFHFSTIGLVGMHEACLNFLGEGIQTKTGKEFAIRVLRFMRERLVEFQNETGNIYNLEATPAEGTSHRLARLDKERYPRIITSGKKFPYYTNSTQLPVGHTNNLFEALHHQDDLQALYNGGTVLHCFLGEAVSSLEGCKLLVRKIAENFELPYFTITPTFSICMEHGYLRGKYPKCPSCGKPAEVYSRIVGYYRPLQNWHVGKQEEFRDRLEYDERVSMKESD